MAAHNQIRSGIYEAAPQLLLRGIILLHTLFTPMDDYDNDVGFFFTAAMVLSASVLSYTEAKPGLAAPAVQSLRE